MRPQQKDLKLYGEKEKNGAGKCKCKSVAPYHIDNGNRTYLELGIDVIDKHVEG